MKKNYLLILSLLALGGCSKSKTDDPSGETPAISITVWDATKWSSSKPKGELSAGATVVPRVKRAVQSLAIPECRELVEETLKLNTSSEILARCLELADKRYGDLLG